MAHPRTAPASSPHLALLAIDVRTWPIIPVHFAAGLLLGWLRHRTGSFVPGAAVHAISNLVAGVIALRALLGRRRTRCRRRIGYSDRR
ncbi:type II CAAX prenyl endopeptidase Rce1 family protein [Microbacterium sp. P06]|uniref:CPBP family glutamic-type intramembrane protease n=1 Tax=Microbacterium sp. P06 TaxID=3366949 RepID=UPI003744F541